MTLEELENEIRCQDESDSTRSLSPLVQLKMPNLLIALGMNINEVIELVKLKIESPLMPRGRKS